MRTSVLIGALTLMGSVFTAFGPWGSTQTQDGLKRIPDEALLIDLWVRAHSSPGYLRMFEHSVGGKFVRHKRCERADGGRPWHCWTRTESTTYYVTALAATDGGDQLFVAGVFPDGSAVIERWTYARRERGWYSLAPPAPGDSPLGTHLPPAAVRIEVEGGGAWKAPEQSWSLPAAERTQLVKTQTGPFQSLAAEPQGRYLIYDDNELGALFSVSLLDPDPIPVLLASAASHPQLDQVGSIQVMDFSDQGRKLLVRRNFKGCVSGSSEVYTVFSDPENDGTFVFTATLDSAQWKVSPYSDWSLWDSYWHP